MIRTTPIFGIRNSCCARDKMQSTFAETTRESTSLLTTPFTFDGNRSSVNYRTHPSNSNSATTLIPIQLPNTTVTHPIAQLETIPSFGRTRLQNSNGMFDSNNSSPANEFIQTLKHRMDVYYNP